MGPEALTQVPEAWSESISKSKSRQYRSRRRQGRRASCSPTQIFRSDLAPLPFQFMLIILLSLLPANFWIDGAPTDDGTPSIASRRFRDPRITFYELLGVSKLSSQQEIKRVFRKLAVKMHPDKLGPFESTEAEVEANAVFAKILKAYQTLGDPEQRQKYDASGMAEDTTGVRFGATQERRYEESPFGIFVRFGSGRGGLWLRYKGQGQKRAPDTVITLPVTLEEVFEGKRANITVTRERLCRTCGGTGAKHPEEMPTCELCEGKGYAYHLFGVHGTPSHNHNSDHPSHASGGSSGGRCWTHADGSRGNGGEGGLKGSDVPGYAHAVNTTCKVCGGTGKISDGGCEDCLGRRVKMETATFEVNMPAGAPPGHTINFGGLGTEHPDKLPGSIQVVAAQLPHPRFEREGDNLVYRKKISLLAALEGFERKLTLLDGSRVRIVHDEVTLSGYRKELPELGFPVMGKGSGHGKGERGALIVDFEVDFPPELGEAHLVALRAVLTEEEVRVLEDVLKLMSARKAGSWRREMDPLEYRYTRFCSVDGEGDEYSIIDDVRRGRHSVSGGGDLDLRRCIPDLLWWARPWPDNEDDLEL